ncbi:hypothetical protein AMK59_5109, partial [Oryctes borbonicus]
IEAYRLRKWDNFVETNQERDPHRVPRILKRGRKARWKSARVIPVLKPKKDPHSPDSYRQISLLGTISKILESLLLARINEHLVDNHLTDSDQFGFRSDHSTMSHFGVLFLAPSRGLLSFFFEVVVTSQLCLVKRKQQSKKRVYSVIKNINGILQIYSIVILRIDRVVIFHIYSILILQVYYMVILQVYYIVILRVSCISNFCGHIFIYKCFRNILCDFGNIAYLSELHIRNLSDISRCCVGSSSIALQQIYFQNNLFAIIVTIVVIKYGYGVNLFIIFRPITRTFF